MEELTARARRGDDDALAELWRTHHHRVSRYLRGRGVQVADDLASQVWIDVARGIRRFDGGDEDFPRWLFTIARRRYVDHVRSAVRRPEALVDEWSGDGAQMVEPEVSAEDRYDADAALDRAIALVRRLPEPMGEVVLLRVVGDLSVAEVAELTGKTEGNVRVLAHRGLQRLRELVAGTSAERPDHEPVTRGTSSTMEGLT